jgi:S1-C subfamily serine protease
MRAALCLALALAVLPGARAQTAADLPRTIERVKGSIVAVGTFQRARSPAFRFLGTGFAVGDGATIATNAHVLPANLDSEKFEILAVVLPTGGSQVQLRAATRGASDAAHDLALLRIEGAPLPALTVRDSDGVREGELVLFTGFPIGNVLGPFPATHRGMVAAITPIAIPPAHSSQLDPRLIRQLADKPFPVFQLDATAYPGNSGSPVYAADSGEVIGIVNMVFVKGSKESALTQPSGITYAIPSRHLVELMKQGGR